MYKQTITLANRYEVCKLLAKHMLACDMQEFNTVNMSGIIDRGVNSLLGSTLYAIPDSLYVVVTAAFQDIHAEGTTVGIQLLLCPNGLNKQHYRSVMSAIREDLRKRGVTWLITSRRVSPYKYLYEYKPIQEVNMGVVKDVLKGVMGIDDSARKAAERAAEQQEKNMRAQTAQADAAAKLEAANALGQVANVQAGGQEARDVYEPKKKRGSGDTLGINTL